MPNPKRRHSKARRNRRRAGLDGADDPPGPRLSCVTGNPAGTMKPQLLHLVFGGELKSLEGVEFKDVSKLDIVGIYRSASIVRPRGTRPATPTRGRERKTSADTGRSGKDACTSAQAFACDAADPRRALRAHEHERRSAGRPTGQPPAATR